jgi:flagellar biosynthesis/type III secretory pathway protein FliH
MARAPRATVLRGDAARDAAPLRVDPAALGRRVAAVEHAAHRRAEAILQRAEAEAARIVAEGRRAADDARLSALEEARALALGEVAAALHRAAERERDAHARATERIIEVATLLAERLLGETLSLAPERVTALARTALHDAAGARDVRLRAHPLDAPLLRDALADARALAVTEDAELSRGDLVLETDVGVLQARVPERLDRLAAHLRETLER